jgi:predicted amidohydrolase
MPRQVTIASLQIDAAPASNADRLLRIEALLAQAAAQGAQLAVLPELFNTGYSYTAENYNLSEPLEGPTHRWMRAQAERHRMYLAGALLLRDAVDFYDSMLLIAPKGQTWRYDKSYPWGWERAYFRPGRGPFVAETPLGRIGMLICWDIAHRDQWTVSGCGPVSCGGQPRNLPRLHRGQIGTG